MGLKFRLVKISIKRCTCSSNGGLILVALVHMDTCHGFEKQSFAQVLSSLKCRRTDEVEDTACTASSRCVQHPASIGAEAKDGNDSLQQHVHTRRLFQPNVVH